MTKQNGLRLVPVLVGAIAMAGLWMAHILLTLRFGIETLFDNPSSAYLTIIGGMLIALIPFSALLIPRFRPFRWHSHKGGFIALAVWLILLAALGWGGLARARHIANHPLNPLHGDMLPLIVSACEHLLSGTMPYTVHQVPWDLPMTFPPGLWLPYLPGVAFGWDPRWLGVAALALACIGTIVIARRWPWPAVIVAALTWLPFCLAAAWVDFTIQGHTQLIWLYAAFLAWAVIGGHIRWAALSVGLLMASRQTMLIAVVPVWFWIYHQVGWKEALKSLLWMGVPVVLLLGPFLLVDYDATLFAPLRHYGELAAYEWGRGAAGHMALTPGFTYWLRTQGLGSVSSVATLVVMFVMGVGAFKYARTSFGLLAGLGLGSLVFNAFTPIPWFYIYAPSLIWLGMSLAAWAGAALPQSCLRESEAGCVP